MNRAKQIAIRGALNKAITIATFGFFPAPESTSRPIVSLTTLARNFNLTIPARNFNLTYRRDR